MRSKGGGWWEKTPEQAEMTGNCGQKLENLNLWLRAKEQIPGIARFRMWPWRSLNMNSRCFESFIQAFVILDHSRKRIRQETMN